MKYWDCVDKAKQWLKLKGFEVTEWQNGNETCLSINEVKDYGSNGPVGNDQLIFNVVEKATAIIPARIDRENRTVNVIGESFSYDFIINNSEGWNNNGYWMIKYLIELVAYDIIGYKHDGVKPENRWHANCHACYGGRIVRKSDGKTVVYFDEVQQHGEQ